ncbi:MAG TPA: DNRLRE domain-containing protein, partial [Ktedonobacteraceae bacterium]|nr:DNRLRE domain-containing protein [Ktedonobacteraceae bacterium]
TTYTIRNNLNNQVVTDGMVGGSLSCGNHGLNRWTHWGTQTYPAASQVNIQNEADISDWDCFSKFYITFPLSSLPAGNVVANAQVTLYEYGNAGAQGQPNPSYIQVAVINQNWNPATLSWNTAPLVGENITSMLVPTKSQPTVPPPGLPITWDVSRAVAAAYAADQPLRLVFYSTDNQYNTGKYFWSSTVGDWNATGRPTLQVSLGS